MSELKPQTIASKKWAEKAGLKVKAFKIKKDLCERFEKTCEERNETQVDVISRLMERYIRGE